MRPCLLLIIKPWRKYSVIVVATENPHVFLYGLRSQLANVPFFRNALEQKACAEFAF
jgi:hypothetical protein